MSNTMHIFVGYDSRESDAYDVCLKSIKLNNAANVFVHPLNHLELRKQGLFKRRWLVNEEGQYIDLEDNLPFSTEFSHSRFLTPIIAKQMGIANSAVLLTAVLIYYVSVFFPNLLARQLYFPLGETSAIFLAVSALSNMGQDIVIHYDVLYSTISEKAPHGLKSGRRSQCSVLR